MHKTKNILLLILLFATAKLVFPQQNSLKVGLLGATIGDYAVGVEQVLFTNYSMNVKVGYCNLAAGLINFDNFLTEGQTLWFKDKGLGFNGTLDLRSYFSFDESKTAKNFYWGPYIRFWNYNLLFSDFIENDMVRDHNLFDVKVKLKGMGIGVQLGYHLTLTDKIWMDFYFIGLGAERVKMKAEYKSVDMDNFDYGLIENDVNAAFSNTPGFIKNKVKVWSTAERLNIELPVFLPGIRTGVSIAFVID